MTDEEIVVCKKAIDTFGVAHQQLKAVEAIIDEHVRPMLEMDGGNMEILDIKSEESRIDIYIRYLGACSGCASGATGTLYAIENILQESLSPNIRVIPV